MCGERRGDAKRCRRLIETKHASGLNPPSPVLTHKTTHTHTRTHTHTHAHTHTHTQPALPLEVGTLVDCRWRDGTLYTARVVERRPAALEENAPPPPAETCAPEAWEYYVHYLKFNRRMDEWVPLTSLALSTVDGGDVDADGKRRKRADGDADDDHAEFDAHALREHEEFTKVKNVERIELGRHEMETWYFSPLPPEFKDAKKLYFAEFDLAVSVCGEGGMGGGVCGGRGVECCVRVFAHPSFPPHTLPPPPVLQTARPNAAAPQKDAPAAPARG